MTCHQPTWDPLKYNTEKDPIQLDTRVPMIWANVPIIPESRAIWGWFPYNHHHLGFSQPAGTGKVSFQLQDCDHPCATKKKGVPYFPLNPGW